MIANGVSKASEVITRGHHQAVAVEQPIALGPLADVETFEHHRLCEQFGNASGGRTATEKQEAAVGQFATGAAGTLDVIVVAADLVSASFENWHSFDVGEVFPLERHSQYICRLQPARAIARTYGGEMMHFRFRQERLCVCTNNCRVRPQLEDTCMAHAARVTMADV